MTTTTAVSPGFSRATCPANSNYRWVICALLFFATVIAYVDRGILGYLQNYLATVIGWNAIQYSHITTAFSVAYAVGLLCAGPLTDRLGTRNGFVVAIVIWSIAAMLPGAATSVLTFGIAMFLLGLGESANFPACIKTVAEWFPKKERALSAGIFNSGANVGNIVVPLIVPLLMVALGWRGSFVVCGALGFVWLAFWLWLYGKPEEHRRVSAAELELIQSDPAETVQRAPWLHVLPHKQTWAYGIAKFLTDPIWWFYVFWLPGYLQQVFHLSLAQCRPPVAIIYAISIVGSVGGGWIPSLLFQRGVSINRGRKTALLICALAVAPVLLVPFVHSLWLVVALIGIAAAAHQGWSANVLTLPSDMFPKAVVATVVSVGGMLGAVGNALMQSGTGYIVTWTHSYVPVFAIAGTVYVVALAIVHIISPKLEAAKMQ
jgi:ACS family hexuronate transporter-like MFS transporter